MDQTNVRVPQGSASGLSFARLPMTSGRATIRVHITTDIETYISSDALSGDIVISHRIRRRPSVSAAYQTMLASEAVLARDWNQPEEDEAWADL